MELGGTGGDVQYGVWLCLYKSLVLAWEKAYLVRKSSDRIVSSTMQIIEREDADKMEIVPGRS